MRRVVADTSPLFYLLSIDLIDLLPQLFGRLSIPDAVHNELNHPRAPLPVRDWAAVPPSWLGVVPVDTLDDLELVPLGDGERAAITLAQFLKADLILINERKGTAVALNKGFEVTGTLGVWAWRLAMGTLIWQTPSRGSSVQTSATARRLWMHSQSARSLKQKVSSAVKRMTPILRRYWIAAVTDDGLLTPPTVSTTG